MSQRTDELFEAITCKLAEIDQSKCSILLAKRAIGESLIEARKELDGEWVQWLEQKFKWSTASAYNYIEIADNWELVKDAKSCREAKELITAQNAPNNKRSSNRSNKRSKPASDFKKQAYELLRNCVNESSTTDRDLEFLILEGELKRMQMRLLAKLKREATPRLIRVLMPKLLEVGDNPDRKRGAFEEAVVELCYLNLTPDEENRLNRWRRIASGSDQPANKRMLQWKADRKRSKALVDSTR